MITDWDILGKEIGSESGGHDYAQKALEEVLGAEWITATVEYIMSFERGSEFAMNCLRLLKSEKAVLYAYDVYKNATGERADRAVWLIKHIHHPIALNWVNEFLNDENVAHWGQGVLDQLLWTEEIQIDSMVIQLLNKAETVFDGGLKENVAFIREYLKGRDEIR